MYLIFKIANSYLPVNEAHESAPNNSSLKPRIIIIIFSLLCLSYILFQRDNVVQSREGSIFHEKVNSTRFPKVWWIYTENEYDAESMDTLLYLNHFNETAHTFGYEVRFVNSWNSYDWLSQEITDRITKVRNNCKVDEEVHNMLRIALLLENGGVMVEATDMVILGDNFNWL